ncbi:hypothetical protein BC937DRAFT_87332 [Endogone sp. FLAS-F59071]|nr:hypothetical protein BC937DRAFT_87332 [Endogone sp. FLAS-F59071]|eukprot:RUS19524.1 hypothetical protein BC937DRAFT_87332 [Endogone sp. FLAS-F59071]
MPRPPKLPDATLDKYLRSVRPLLSDANYARTLVAVEEFRALNGAGERLQDRLLARARNSTNWVEDWWIHSYYLGYRDSVVINTSYFIAYPDNPLRAFPAARAASLVTAVLNFREQLWSGYGLLH